MIKILNVYSLLHWVISLFIIIQVFVLLLIVLSKLCPPSSEWLVRHPGPRFQLLHWVHHAPFRAQIRISSHHHRACSKRSWCWDTACHCFPKYSLSAALTAFHPLPGPAALTRPYLVLRDPPEFHPREIWRTWKVVATQGVDGLAGWCMWLPSLRRAKRQGHRRMALQAQCRCRAGQVQFSCLKCFYSRNSWSNHQSRGSMLWFLLSLSVTGANRTTIFRPTASSAAAMQYARKI